MNTNEPRDDFPDETPVLVVGAGPSGLMLAAELALAGTQPLLIDALERATGQSRALGFTVRTLEIFQQRGILARFGELTQQPGVHFAGLRIDSGHLSSPVHPANQYPQSRTEEALAGWAGDLGVRVHRPWRLVSVEPRAGRYHCLLEGPAGRKVVSAGFVVGCDGARSRVRESTAIASRRTEPSVQMLVGDLRGSGLADRPFGVKHRGGMVMSAPLGDGTERVIVCDFSRPFAPQGSQITHEQVRLAYRNVVGEPLEAGECLWASSFTDASALVDAYREGGILLVGDSAHTHLPAGGQGMNVSIQDAVNLGWKLAAVVQGRAPDSLLDTYQSERRPVAEELLRNTAAQGQLFLRGPEVDPLRQILAGLLEIPAVARRLGDSVSGLDVRYDLGDENASPLVGSRLAPAVLVDPRTGGDPADELRHGQALLVVLGSAGSGGRDDLGELEEEARRRQPHLRLVTAEVTPEGADFASVRAVFVRPDGHVAWAGHRLQDLQASLTAWLGTPAAQTLEV